MRNFFLYASNLLYSLKVYGLILTVLGSLLLISCISYDRFDVSTNFTSEYLPNNFLGYFGAYVSDVVIQTFGFVSAVAISLYFLYVGILCFIDKIPRFFKLRSLFFFLSVILLSFSTSSFCDSIISYFTTKLIGKSNLYYLVSYILYVFFLIITFDLMSFFRYLPKLLRYKKPIVQSIEYIATYDYRDKSKTDEDDCVDERKDEINYPKTTNNNSFVLPSTSLLNKTGSQNVKTESFDELQKKSEELISVLNDFGVRGQILDIHRGPVVTLYEFEPIAGTKSSRVIGLADDIARSLCALSARISVIQGRNALGIELPNSNRQFFNFRELVESKEYKNKDILLPIVLGKDLIGKPMIVDLAKMPHLLVAGTTGSGKSVGINSFILSLLYRYTPSECKFIMIDPKMLELSVYQDIPHLLTPVVTESEKAIIALKWAVKEMESRYRLMSDLGVRNITGYNAKVEEKLKSGSTFSKTIQTGFDDDTKKPTYQTMEIKISKLPFIVVIVDEMADLMLVAGKDIESSIQRLAQMARAAGIHIIMATQRPSVDVITGVIKANFPSRISFKVTSKIDSRTILGEMGAEQLLGAGDMLYMGSSSKITRVHGPFVDDSEVEKLANYLRSQGEPNYLHSVIEKEDENDLEDITLGKSDDDLYKRAIAIVKRDKKPSISYVQRSLRIGYNRAAILIEQMEKDGVVSPPNHSGKREILIED